MKFEGSSDCAVVDVKDLVSANPLTKVELKENPEFPGFTLFINCIPLGEDYIDAADLLNKEGRELAVELKSTSYYELDPFKRKDALASKAEIVASSLKGMNVVALGSSHELKSYLDALRPFAARVVVGAF
jgi:hypothetical protein